MRGFLRGTRHTTLLDRQEARILAALARLPFVQKVEPTFLNWTGPSGRKLRLRQVTECVMEATLHLGTGKRTLLILLRRGVNLGAAELTAGLEAALRPFGIEIEPKGGKTMTNSEMQVAQVPVCGISPEEAWAWCMAIYEKVAEFKKAEEEELELELRLLEVRERKCALQQSAIQSLASGRKPQ